MRQVTKFLDSPANTVKTVTSHSREQASEIWGFHRSSEVKRGVDGLGLPDFCIELLLDSLTLEDKRTKFFRNVVKH